MPLGRALAENLQRTEGQSSNFMVNTLMDYNSNSRIFNALFQPPHISMHMCVYVHMNMCVCAHIHTHIQEEDLELLFKVLSLM